MRIIKLSKDVFGFDNMEGCIAYFRHVLPWQKLIFNIMGEGAHIAPNSLIEGEKIIFSYDGNIVAIAKNERLILDKNNKVKSIKLLDGSLRVFNNPGKIGALEKHLHNIGYSKNIVSAQGWNRIDGVFEKETLMFIRDMDWSYYLS
jgi:hypothetical protein